ncbi:hypothetical protein BJ165DRAFT_1530683 [Panaeolus papilionaceus]|nr:hypothetical protein BJ165DRAFT_1530683 [Panaeolus papilionaceus]
MIPRTSHLLAGMGGGYDYDESDDEDVLLHAIADAGSVDVLRRVPSEASENLPGSKEDINFAADQLVKLLADTPLPPKRKPATSATSNETSVLQDDEEGSDFALEAWV